MTTSLTGMLASGRYEGGELLIHDEQGFCPARISSCAVHRNVMPLHDTCFPGLRQARRSSTRAHHELAWATATNRTPGAMTCGQNDCRLMFPTVCAKPPCTTTITAAPQQSRYTARLAPCYREVAVFHAGSTLHAIKPFTGNRMSPLS